MTDILTNTLRHLWFGARAMAFWRVDRTQMRTAGPEPVIILALSMAAEVLFDLPKADGFSLSVWGVSATFASVLVLIGALLLMRDRERALDKGSVVSILIAMGLVLLPVMALVRFAAEDLLADWPWAEAFESGAGLGVLAWFCAAVWVFGRRSTDLAPRRFGFGLAAAMLASAYLLPATPLLRGGRESSGGLLQYAFSLLSVERKSGSGGLMPAPLDVEATFARQHQLIDAQLDGLAPSRPGKGEVYFVGMATYAMQDVFKREITSARAIMDERFGTHGHSVVLINHRDSVESLPLATVTNLERVLWRLAQRMDLENDALVLFITTHGSEGMMSVSFPRFSLNDLTPDRLAGILARTGIRNKVVVLSACHAGSFLPALARPDTLVMAAARSDRSSFGCSNERDWTYFGDALFNRALRETHSFSGAFERARALVGEWETAQKLAPASEPQVGGGEGITGVLGRVERRLAGW